MRLRVKTLTRRVFGLDVHPTASIDELKARLTQETGIPLAGQKLVYKGEVLQSGSVQVRQAAPDVARARRAPMTSTHAKQTFAWRGQILERSGRRATNTSRAGPDLPDATWTQDCGIGEDDFLVVIVVGHAASAVVGNASKASAQVPPPSHEAHVSGRPRGLRCFMPYLLPALRMWPAVSSLLACAECKVRMRTTGMQDGNGASKEASTRAHDVGSINTVPPPRDTHLGNSANVPVQLSELMQALATFSSAPNSGGQQLSGRNPPRGARDPHPLPVCR